MPSLRIAEELKAATGCTMAAAVAAAAIALSYCENVSNPRPALLNGCLVIRCTTDARFLENWSDHVQGRERCDELNRELDHPAYFIA
jgi:hypothetical protein